MKNAITIFLWLISEICHAQNLVPNGDFENYFDCPISYSQIELVKPWMTPSLGSPDYFNKCSRFSLTGVPKNNWGFQNAHSGNGYCGILLYYLTESDVREYIEVPLSSPLQLDYCYHFEMYVNLGNACRYTTNDIQVYLSNQKIEFVQNYHCIPKPFQISSNGHNFDSLTWTLVSGDFKSAGGESFLTIGNFKYDFSTNIVLLSNSSIQQSSYVYIDDVSLIQIPCEVIVNNINKENIIFLYPNPFSNELLVKSNDFEQKKVILFDVTSRKLIQQNFTNSVSLNTEYLSPGIYFYEVRNKNGLIKNGKVVKD